MLVYPVLRQDPPTKCYGSSLLHRSAHPPELLLLMRSPVTPNMIRPSPFLLHLRNDRS